MRIKASMLPSEEGKAPWTSVLSGYIEQFDQNWSKQLRPAGKKDLNRLETFLSCGRSQLFTHEKSISGGRLHLPDEYRSFLEFAGGSGCEFETPDYWIHFYQISDVLKYFDAESDYALIGSLGVIDTNGLLIDLQQEANAPILEDLPGEQVFLSDSIKNLLFCGAYVQYGVKQFLNRIAAKPSADSSFQFNPCCRDAASYKLCQQSYRFWLTQLSEVLQKNHYERQWFSTSICEIWQKDDGCCILSQNTDCDGLYDTVVIDLFGLEKTSNIDFLIWLKENQWATETC